jgi:hypothetical protein
MAKIFTSRDDELNSIEDLQELVFVAHTALDRDDDPDSDPEMLKVQLDVAVMDMAELIETQRHQIHMLSMDLIQLSLNQALMARDLKVSVLLLEALAKPVNDTEPFLKALALMKREGDPEITTVGNDSNGIEIDVKLTYDEEDLAEALKLAIGEYIAGTAEDTLTP